MKSIKINKNEITITFDSEEKAQALYDWTQIKSAPLLGRNASITGNVFRYDISEWSTKHTPYSPLESLLKKVVYDDKDNFSSERYWGAFSTDKYSNRFNVWNKGDRIFRVTPIREDGVKGVFNFGVHQYTNFISIVLTNNPSEFVFLSDRCHVDDYDGHHQLKFEGYFETGSILIEVVGLQF